MTALPFNVSFRPLTQADFDDCALIEKKLWRERSWEAMDFFNLLAPPSSITSPKKPKRYYGYAADVNHHLAGYAIFAGQRDNDELVNIAVTPEWQRHGIARGLLAKQAQHMIPEKGRFAFVPYHNFPMLHLLSNNGMPYMGRSRTHQPGPDEWLDPHYTLGEECYEMDCRVRESWVDTPKWVNRVSSYNRRMGRWQA